MSPIVDRGLVIVHVGGHNDGALTAFDARTGDVKWAWTGDGPAYGSPIVAELGGTRQVITMTQENLVGVAVADGQLLWKRPYSVRATRNAVTPIVHNQIVIVSGLGMPVSGFRVFNKAGQWSTEDVWVNNDATMDMSTGVVIGDTCSASRRGTADSTLRSTRTRARPQWLSEPRQGDNAAVVRAGDLWFALDTSAELKVARANAKQFEILKRYDVADSATWAQPVLSGQGLSSRTCRTISLWTLN